MELDYRAVFQVRPPAGRSLINESFSAIYSWLKQKNLNADLLSYGLIPFSDTTVGTLAKLEQRDGSVVQRFRLTEARPMEDAPPQTWMTEILTVQRNDGHGDFLIHVADPRREAQQVQPQPTGVPGIVRTLVATTQASDGQMKLLDEPAILDIYDEDLVHDLIVDETRRGLLILASAAKGASVEQFRHQIHELTRGTVGQAGVFILTAQLASVIDGRTGYLHFPSGGMRAVPPGCDPGVRLSAAASYFITAQRLSEREPHRVGRHWTWMAREHANSVPWPKSLQRAGRAITEFEQSTLLEDVDRFIAERQRARNSRRQASTDAEPVYSGSTVQPAAFPQNDLHDAEWSSQDQIQPAVHADEADLTPPLVGSAASSQDREKVLRDALVRALPNSNILATIMQIGGCATVTESLQFALMLAGDFDTLQSKVTALTQEISNRAQEVDLERLTALEIQIHDLYSENQALEAELDREARGAQFLRTQLINLKRPDLAWSVPEETELAQDFEEVLEIATRFEYAVFTGDRLKTLELGAMRSAQATARKTHRALMAVNDYARAKALGIFTSGGFKEYVNDHPAGFASVSANVYIPTESESVQNSQEFLREREFPMPNGDRKVMLSHIRLSGEGTMAPRMYFEDDTSRSGLVVVGYIGRHPTNTRTN